MSATTPAVRGGLTSRQLGTALAAVVLAMAVVAALIAYQAVSTRGDAGTAAPRAATFDHGSSSDAGNVPLTMLPRAAEFDHGSSTSVDNVPAPVLLELPRVFDPSSLSGTGTPVGGGRGTRIAR